MEIQQYPGEITHVTVFKVNKAIPIQAVEAFLRAHFDQRLLPTLRAQQEAHAVLRSSPTPPTKDWNCTVCLDGVNQLLSYTTLDCGHIYHNECLSGWEGNTCPQCRGPKTTLLQLRAVEPPTKRRRISS